MKSPDDHQQQLDEIKVKLDGFEAKFEQLTDAILKLTKIEERMAAIIEGNRDLRDSIKNNNLRIQVLEREQARSTVFERIFWIIITISIGGYFAGKLFMGS